MTRRLEVRFWDNAQVSDGCWEWGGLRMTVGYGRMIVGGRVTGAHRVSWMLHHGPIPAGMFVCHTCDNRGCVRPDHLFLGTQLDNMRDASLKGRVRNQYRNPTHCQRGHELAGSNVYRDPHRLTRACRACREAARARWHERQAAAILARELEEASA